jgi:hypothetical protein
MPRILYAHTVHSDCTETELGGVKTKYPPPYSHDISPVKASAKAACITIVIPHGVYYKNQITKYTGAEELQ